MEPATPIKKTSIFHKLIISYAAISLFTLTAFVVSYSGLYSLNTTVRDIVSNDFMLINSVNSLRESLLAQQSYAAKFAILKEPEFRNLFLQQETEFLIILQKTKKRTHDPSLEDIDSGYQKFRNTAHRLFHGDAIAPGALKTVTEQLELLIEKTQVDRQKLLNIKIEAASQREKTTVKWTLFLSLSGFLLGIGVAALLIYNISRAMRKLKKATHRIAEGDFDFEPGIEPGDEVGDLAEDFTRMAKRLKELEQISLDASPLTRLPGNIAIEQVLVRKLDEGETFAVCYADLDNFKAYNDRYGYIRASELIKKTGEIVYDAVKAIDSGDNFVGHIGGDDFVMVVAPEHAAQVCKTVIEKFDGMIPVFYSSEDNAMGAIEGVDRYGVKRRFPVMTISISIVICQQGSYDSASSIAKAAAEMKDFIKGKEGSNYSFNRRSRPR